MVSAREIWRSQSGGCRENRRKHSSSEKIYSGLWLCKEAKEEWFYVADCRGFSWFGEIEQLDLKEIGVFDLTGGATGAVEDENGSKMKIDTG